MHLGPQDRGPPWVYHREGQGLWKPGGGDKGGNRMGSSVRGWRSAGWQSTVLRVVCVEGLGRAECWAGFVHLSGYWCLSCVWASRLESLPPLGDILVVPSLCSQVAAMDLTQTNLCSLTRHESEVRGEVCVAVGVARLHLTACQLPGPLSKGQLHAGLWGGTPRPVPMASSVPAGRTAAIPWPVLQCGFWIWSWQCSLRIWVSGSPRD